MCSLATLTAKKLLSTTGLTATCGSNVLDVNATNTAITGPLSVSGSISLSSSGMTLKTSTGVFGGVSFSGNALGYRVLFMESGDVNFYGSTIACTFANLTAKKLISTQGLSTMCLNTVLEVNATNTTITGPLVVNGTVSGTGFSGYATSSSVTVSYTHLTLPTNREV